MLMLIATRGTSLKPRGRIELLLQLWREVFVLDHSAKVADFASLEVGNGIMNHAESTIRWAYKVQWTTYSLTVLAKRAGSSMT